MGVGLILVLFTYGGWNEMVYVASEVQNPRRNIARALVLGTVAVMSVYLLTNAAFVHALSLPGLAQSQAIATDAVSHLLPRYGQMVVAAVIVISCAGSLNGLILTGARITGAMQPFPPFGWIGRWNARTQTPMRALILQGVISIVVICVAKTFEKALIYTASAVYIFYLATSMSVAVLRFTDSESPRSFRVPLFPLPLLVFGAGCLWAIRSAIQYDPVAAKICFGVIGAGLVVFAVNQISARVLSR
jgi:amino acid transporter